MRSVSRSRPSCSCRAGRNRAGPDLQPRRGDAVRWSPRFSAPPGCCRAASTHGHRAGDRRRGGSRRDRSRRVGLARVRPHGPADPGDQRSRGPEALFAALGVGLWAPRRAVRQRCDAHRRHARLRRSARRARPILPRLPGSVRDGRELHLRTGGRWKNRMFWPRGEDAATGSAAGPIACHACRHGRAEWGEYPDLARGRDRQAVDALRSGRRGPPGSTRSSSEVEPWSSLGASSASVR